jgi:hypothetical protein
LIELYSKNAFGRVDYLQRTVLDATGLAALHERAPAFRLTSTSYFVAAARMRLDAASRLRSKEKRAVPKGSGAPLS